VTIDDPAGEFAKNLDPILPAAICLDISASMAEAGKIESLNEAVGQFINAVRKDKRAARTVAWEFITFQGDPAGDPVIIAHLGDFRPAADLVDLPDFVADGNTPMAEAVDLALKLLDAVKEDAKQRRRPYFQPWLVVMTDGMPTSQPEVMDDLIRRVRVLSSDRKLVVIVIGIGANADAEFLQHLSPDRPPDMIADDQILEYFSFLSSEFVSASRGTPGEATTAESFEATGS
jgi:uncharacterized protein YegL